MTEFELHRIETDLRLSIPQYYKDFLLNYPVEIGKESLGLKDSDEGIEDLFFLNDPDIIIQLNLNNRKSWHPDLSISWSPNYFAIGIDGTGGTYFIDTELKIERIFFFHIVDNELVIESNSLEKCVKDTKDMFLEIIESEKKTIMQEYKIGKGWAIFIYIFAPLLIALFGWLLIMPFVLDDTPFEMLYFLAPLSLGMIGLIVVGILDTIKGKVIISSDTLSIRSTFINRDLKFQEIKGFQIDQNYIFVLPNTETKKRIKISTYIGKSNELIMWLSSNFPDLHQVNEEKEEAEILNDLEYGRNSEERLSQLNQAKKVAKVLNWIGGLIFVWTLFKPEPYEYAILASISLPIIAILVVIYYKGLIRINEKKGSAYPNAFFAISMTFWGLLLRALLDYNIFDYSKIWTPSGIIGVVMIAFIVYGTKEFKFKKAKDYFTVLFLTVFFFGFGYGSIVTLNCMYDESIPQTFQSQVIDKRISTGKITTYYLKLTPWGTQTKSDDVSVTEELYKNLEIDDNVIIYLKKGQFEIPWFIITAE
jgi:hypothetical protein